MNAQLKVRGSFFYYNFQRLLGFVSMGFVKVIFITCENLQ